MSLNEHMFSFLLGTFLGVELLGEFVFNFLRNCQIALHHTVQQAMCDIPVFPHLCQCLLLYVFFIVANSSECKMASYSFNVPCWVSFHMLIKHLCIFFGEISMPF